MAADGVKCRRWVVSKAGHLDNMRLADSDIPVPEKGEVLVKVHSCGLNMADVFSVLGLYSAAPLVRIPCLSFDNLDVSVAQHVCKAFDLKRQ